MLNFFKKKDPIKLNYKYFALLDNDTNAVLVVGDNFNYINFLKEYTLDSYLVAIPSFNKYKEKFIAELPSSNMCYLLCWDFNKNLFIKNKNVTELLKEKSILANSKYKNLENISIRISSLRSHVKKTLPFQETIYLSKKIEAQRFRDRGYPEKEILDFPYVLQYADFKKITMTESADRILLKSSIDEEMLAKTELLRLVYFNKIKDSKSVQDVEDAYTKFLLDFNIKI